MKKKDEEYPFEFQPVYEPCDWITEEEFEALQEDNPLLREEF